MANPTEVPKYGRKRLLLVLFSGLLPYFGAATLVVLTRSLPLLAVACGLICVVSTMGAYLERRTRDRVYAKHRLIIDPMLYGFEFVFTAVLIRYVFLQR